MKIAALLTCYNRKDKTLESLRHLFSAVQNNSCTISLQVYLTDDGCSDGTAEAVHIEFPEVIILKGNGSLFWAGGMRNSWNVAIKENFDIYLLLNDDTNVYANLFDEMLTTHEFSLNHYGTAGIYIGSTIDINTKDLSYGGALLTNKFFFKYTYVLPNGKIQECTLGNGNIMFVSKNVTNTIGILSERFVHSVADFDYTLTARKKHIPVLITPNYCGECCCDNPNAYEIFKRLTFTKRIGYLKSPVGLAFNENLKFINRHFLLRLPFVYLTGWLKVLLPNLYVFLSKLRTIF